MFNPPNNPVSEIDEDRLRLLRGKPLVSRARWLMWRIGYVILLGVLLVVVLAFLEGIWMIVSVTILALAASVLPELLMDLRYSKYRREWEVANRTDAQPSK